MIYFVYPSHPNCPLASSEGFLAHTDATVILLLFEFFYILLIIGLSERILDHTLLFNWIKYIIVLIKF